jgi:hypothetical protein
MFLENVLQARDQKQFQIKNSINYFIFGITFRNDNRGKSCSSNHFSHQILFFGLQWSINFGFKRKVHTEYSDPNMVGLEQAIKRVGFVARQFALGGSGRVV